MEENKFEDILFLGTIITYVTIATIQILCCIIDALYTELSEAKELVNCMKT